MVNQNSRLDIHEQQIQQLQSDVAAIKASLSVLEADRVESVEFRKMMLGCMKKFESETKPKIDSVESGIEHETLGSSGIQFVVQLEEIVSRSDERWGAHSQVHLQAVRSSSDAKSMAPVKSSGTQLVDVQSQFHKIGILSDRFQELVGFGTIEGHGMELKTEVQLASSDLGSYKPPKLFDLVADPKPLDPFINLKSEFFWKLFCSGYKTANQVVVGAVGSIFLWVVHGQGRPPENTLGKPSFGCHVLLDTSKQKAYDDELRREDLLNYFRRFHNATPQNKRHGFFGSAFGRSEVHVDDPLGESRRIACQKCGSFHMWFYSKKTKSRARSCQDCKDFHPAKDGDGWVEQSSQPFLFGIFQKVDAPHAYVCTDSKIYDATEWYLCQGMRCPANTHKPSFHVNTSVMSKHSTSNRASSSHRGGGMPNMDETMTEEEFMEWLQNAVQSGMFDNFAAANGGSPSNSTKNGSSSKRKRKGKKW